MTEKSGWTEANLPLGPVYDFSSNDVKEKKTINSIGLLKPRLF